MKLCPLLLCLFLITTLPMAGSAAPVTVGSPDGKIQLQVLADKKVSLKLSYGHKTLMDIADVALETDKGLFPATGAKILKVRKNAVNRTVKPVIREKQAEIPELYNEVMITFSDKSSLQFRVYNNGMAYRYLLDLPGELKIINDNAHFVFDKDATLTFQKDNRLNSDYEKPYIKTNINDLNINDMGNLPALVQTASGECILLLEANSRDYPVMWIKKTEQGLTAHYPGVPDGYNDKGNCFSRKQIMGNRDYIAQTKASRDFPWKVFAVAENETGLLTNQLVYLLGDDCKIDDTSWIKPGWVTFDWWSKLGIYDVDFKAGINDATAKYMIDFAAEFGLRYFLFDDGWTYNEDLTKTIPGLNMPEIVRYAETKNVDVMLWVTYACFDDQMDAAIKQFKAWGIKGVKIDFMNRSDQEIVNFYWRAAEACAKNKLVIDFHGAYRPDGLRRTYPNVLTREALIEFEYNGMNDWDNPDHHCTLPFIRNVAGPMDYIPGTMNNASKNDFRINGNKPMGQGTRAHAIALAVICESPMQMLSDAQPLYYQNRECTSFLTQIPVEWDEIVPIDGKTGDYVALARRNGDIWYVAAITDWDPRTMELSFDFLSAGKTYRMEIIKDGLNADVTAVDYKKESGTIKKGEHIKINLASGGGWVAKIY